MKDSRGNGRNNWESLDAVSTVPAHVYYGVSETATHWFINYSVFHPRDWHEFLTADMHENDLEAVMVVVKKDAAWGSLVAVETLAHDQFYQYAYAAGIGSGADNVDGAVTLWNGHPRIFIEAKGHGIFNCDGRCDSAPGGDGIVYEERDAAESPVDGSGNWSRVVGYKLIAMDADGSIDGNQGFWHRRMDICGDGCTFGSWGRLRGDNHGADKAKLPWVYDDADDGESMAGDMLCDPAAQIDIHLNGTPFSSGFSHAYVNHIYRTHRINLIQARSDVARDPFGGASDIYVKLTASPSPVGADEVIGERAWKRDNASNGIWYGWWYGGYNATGQTQYGEPHGSHYFCRSPGTSVKLEVWDSDSDGDDLMGSLNLTGSADYGAGIDLGDSRLKFDYSAY